MNWTGKEHHHFRNHSEEERIFTSRIVLSFILVIFLFSILLVRYYSLQVLEYETYATLSDRNRIHVRPVPPNRGLIFDRSGNLLADNRPSFTLSIIKERAVDLENTIQRLAKLVNIEDAHITSFRKLLKQRRRPFQAVPLRYNLTEEEIARIAVNEFTLNGVEIEAQLTRYYPKYELYAHTVGYVGRISEQELSRFDEETYKRYSGTHSIGKIGLEKSYEDVLLGLVGNKYIETNAHGRVLRVLDQNNPEPGKDLQLFLDTQMQQVSLDALDGRRGSVVAVDIETGGILVMVSAPSFDPNLFVTGISFADYRALNESKDLPLFNRSIQGQYPPGSTIKPMLGLGALASRIISYDSYINDPGFYQLENDERLYRDWNFKLGGHGSHVDLKQAIIESCDTFFYDMAVRMGVDRIHEFGVHFGLGTKTGVDIPSERSGLWPSRRWKKETRGLSWYPGDSLNLSIGQGDALATPLQLAVMTATIGSRGVHRKPRLVKRIGEVETEVDILGEYDGDAQQWDYILAAMEGVVHSARGTARKIAQGAKYRIAGKTGTVQLVSIAQGEEYDAEKLAERNRDHALFVGFAPADDPKVAVSVIVENGGGGSSVAAPVARKVLDSYMRAFAGENIHGNK